MTQSQKILVTKLLTGHFLRKMKRRGKEWYVLYDAKINPLEKVNTATVENIDRLMDQKLWKKDKKGTITLSLSVVRQLHGNCLIKRLYKQKDSLDTNFSIYKSRNSRRKLIKKETNEKVRYLF